MTGSLAPPAVPVPLLLADHLFNCRCKFKRQCDCFSCHIIKGILPCMDGMGSKALDHDFPGTSPISWWWHAQVWVCMSTCCLPRSCRPSPSGCVAVAPQPTGHCAAAEGSASVVLLTACLSMVVSRSLLGHPQVRKTCCMQHPLRMQLHCMLPLGAHASGCPWLDNLRAVVQVINNGVAHADGRATADIMGMVQDALDSVEFIMGPPDSQWGAKRAAMGHPNPWNLTYFAIGNEVCAGGANQLLAQLTNLSKPDPAIMTQPGSSQDMMACAMKCVLVSFLGQLSKQAGLVLRSCLLLPSSS